jgi:hypothetical protein
MMNIANSLLWRSRRGTTLRRRGFSKTLCRRQIKDIDTLPSRLIPIYQGVRERIMSTIIDAILPGHD